MDRTSRLFFNSLLNQVASRRYRSPLHHDKERPVPGYTTLPGVVLTPEARQFVASVAETFGKSIVVTSGYRSPAKQAGAMYAKFALGGSPGIYRQHHAAVAVFAVYVEGVAHQLSRDAITDNMAAVLDQQRLAGTYLSDHMRSNAVDLRSFNLSQTDKQKLIAACRAHGATVVLDESQPTHLHIPF